MRNKVLIINANPAEKEEFEKILQGIVEEGGEIFFAERKEDALSIIKKEHPQLVFLDISLIENNGKEKEWVFEGVHIVVVRHKHEFIDNNKDFILKPLRRHQVLEKCKNVLNAVTVPEIPPM